MLSRKGSKDRYITGMHMESQGVPPEQIAQLLGFASAISWESTKAYFSRRNNKVERTRTVGIPNRLERYKHGLILEEQGLSLKEIADQLGFVSPKSWTDERRRISSLMKNRGMWETQEELDQDATNPNASCCQADLPDPIPNEVPISISFDQWVEIAIQGHEVLLLRMKETVALMRKLEEILPKFEILP